jgi:hypothetical protein
MLIEVIDDEFEAQGCTNPAQFPISIDASSFESGPNWHGFFQFHVQTCSATLPDHESIKRNGSCVKNFEKKIERRILMIF